MHSRNNRTDFGPLVFSPFWGSITGGLAHPAAATPPHPTVCKAACVGQFAKSTRVRCHELPQGSLERSRRFRKPRFLRCLPDTSETATKRCPIFWVNQLRLATETAVSPKSKQMCIFSNTNMTFCALLMHDDIF